MFSSISRITKKLYGFSCIQLGRNKLLREVTEGRTANFKTSKLINVKVDSTRQLPLKATTFSKRVYLDKRNSTYCIPTNRKQIAYNKL